MAPLTAMAHTLFTSSLFICIALADGLRYGQNSQSLHIREVKDEDYMGKGFHSIVTDGSFQENEHLIRSKRDLHDSTPAHPNISHKVELNDHHYQMIIHWAGAGSDAIVVLTRDGVYPDNSTSLVYVSTDYGESFNVLDKFKVPYQPTQDAYISRFYNSPVYNSHYVFTDVHNKLIFTTTNYGTNVKRYSVEFAARQISMHPKDVHHILAYDTEDPQKQLWHSPDFGETWSMIQVDVKSFFWGSTDDDEEYSLYVERQSAAGGFVLSSNNFYRTSTVLLNNVADFQLIDDYMFASCKRPQNALSLYVSHKRQPFQQAVFPYEDMHKDYFIADASEEQVFVCVYHNETSTHLYMSDATGVRFTLSLRNVVYFNPDFRNGSLISLFIEKPFADVYKVEGIHGIYIASRFLNSSFSLYNQASMVSYDKGASWSDIVAPSLDAAGNSTGCSTHFHWSARCSLHLAQNYHQYHPEVRSMPILSKESAIGIVMASGTLGNTIGGSMNLYVSNDAGVMWREAFKGQHFYALGDHGGILVAVRQMELTGELWYSLNEGEVWHQLEFSPSKVRVYGLLSEPGEKTTIFSVFASNPSPHSWIIYKIDLKSMLGAPCQAPDDYKHWSPTESNKIDCILGERMVFERRRAHSLCYNGQDYEREISTERCECSEVDYECDLGFKQTRWGRFCNRDNSSNIDINRIPRPCPEGTYYNRTKGYRRISGDRCEGGVAHRFEPDIILCPLREQDEFMLYTSQRTIHRRSFTRGLDEVLPTEGLQITNTIEFDYKHNCLFYGDFRQDLIQKLCLGADGSRRPQTIIGERLGAVEGLALDWMSDTLFWVDAEHKRIEIASTNGSRRRVLINNATLMANRQPVMIDQPRAIVLFPKFGYLYWSDLSESHPCIMFSWMDGTNISTLVSGHRVHWPNGLAIDEQHHRLYWTDAYKHGIYSTDLHGNDFQMLIQNSGMLPDPFSIAVYKDNIYWTDRRRQAILVTDKYTAGHVWTLANVTGILDLKIMHFASQQGASPCSEPHSGCSSICLERPHSGSTPLPLNRTCLCSAAYTEIIKVPFGEQCGCAAGELPDHDNDGCLVSNGSCTSGQMSCANGKCIPRTWRCDRDHDCGPNDDTDERDCFYNTCAPGMFTCDNNRCIPSTWRCDHDHDCGGDDTSDEPSDCHFATCTPGEFNCNNGRCISHNWICDGDDDCHDGSDENMTLCIHYHRNGTSPTTPAPNCSLGMFRCDNSNCIPQSWYCDWADDCGDSSDEPATCHNATMSPPTCGTRFQCHNGQCVDRSLVCDGVADCLLGDDERNCTTVAPTTVTSECGNNWSFHCDNGACVPMYNMCDRVNDCGDWSDESFCGFYDETTAPPPSYPTTAVPGACSGRDTFACSEGHCIPESWVCDGMNDCKNGEDELNCAKNRSQCSGGYFQCYYSVGCISPSWVCDGDLDCADGSDEIACGGGNNTTDTTPSYRSTCGPADFTCGDGSCVSAWRKCNGRWDCADGSDESYANCHAHVADFSQYDVQFVSDREVTIFWSTNKTGPFKVKVMVRKVHADTWTTKDVEAYEHMVTISDLMPMTSYEFSVALIVNNTAHDSMAVKNFVTKAGAPSVPQDVRLSVKAAVSGQPILVVSWTEPEEPEGHINYFKVYLQSDHSKQIVRTVDVPSGATPTNYHIDLLEFTETETVHVQVSAVTSLEGDKSDTKSIKIIVPGRPQCTYSVQDSVQTTADMIASVMWQYSGNAEFDNIDTFRIVLSPEGVLEGTVDQLVAVSDIKHNGTTYSAQVHGFSPGLQYTGYIQAHNASGYGYMCSDMQIQVVAVGDVVHAPTITLGTEMFSTELTLNLTPPAKPKTYTKDWTPVMKVYYTDNDKLLEFPSQLTPDVKSVDVPSTNIVTLHRLLACNFYMIRAQLIEPFFSQLSDPATRVKTANDPRAPPKHVKVAVNSTTEEYAQVNVSFQSPCDKQPIPLVYVVLVRELWENGSLRFENGFLHVSNQSTIVHTIGKVHRGARYNFTVKMDFADSWEAEAITKVISPHKAPRELTLIPNEVDALLFMEWKPPTNATQSYSYGIYHAVDPGDFELTYRVPHDETMYVFVGLEPAKLHRFKIRLEDVFGYPGEFSRVERYTTPSEEKWRSLQRDTDAPGLSKPQLFSAIIVPCAFVLIVLVTALAVYVMRHRRLQRSLLAYANSHYDTRSGTARFSTSDDLDEDDQPLIQGFSDDEPLIVA